MARWSLPRFPGLWRRVVGLQVAWVELVWGTGGWGPMDRLRGPLGGTEACGDGRSWAPLAWWDTHEPPSLA